MSEVYQCCFCGNSIQPVFPDVGGLLYSMTIDRSRRERPEQQLYCHTLCLLDRLDPSVKLYALDIGGSDDDDRD
jgi:hypothetical protein